MLSNVLSNSEECVTSINFTVSWVNLVTNCAPALSSEEAGENHDIKFNVQYHLMETVSVGELGSFNRDIYGFSPITVRLPRSFGAEFEIIYTESATETTSESEIPGSVFVTLIIRAHDFDPVQFTQAMADFLGISPGRITITSWELLAKRDSWFQVVVSIGMFLYYMYSSNWQHLVKD